MKAIAIWFAAVAIFTVVMGIWFLAAAGNLETGGSQALNAVGIPVFLWMLGMIILVPVGVLTVVVVAVRALLRGRGGSAPGDRAGADLDTK